MFGGVLLRQVTFLVHSMDKAGADMQVSTWRNLLGEKFDLARGVPRAGVPAGPKSVQKKDRI